MTVTVDTVLSFFNAQFPQFTAQTKAQRDAGECTTPAYLSYNNFNMYFWMAADRIATDLAGYGNMTLTDYETVYCMACVIADMRERSNPDWNYSSQSANTNGDGAPNVSISRSDPNSTPYLKMYQDMLKVAYKKYAMQHIGCYNGTGQQTSAFTKDFMLNLYSPVITFDDWIAGRMPGGYY